MDIAPESTPSSERAPTREEMEELLLRVADASCPGEGFTTSLAHAVRVLRRCPWLDGDLRMELAPDGTGTVVHLFLEHGGAVREKALAPVKLDVPLDEFEETLHHAPDFFAPLRMRHHKQRLVFTASGAVSELPPALEIAHESVPHDRPTVKRRAFVVPEALRSGAHVRHDPGGD